MASALELSGMAGQGLSQSSATGVQIISNGSSPANVKAGW